MPNSCARNRIRPDVLNRSILDEIIAIDNGEHVRMRSPPASRGRNFSGHFIGDSAAALEIAARNDAAGKMIVVLLADTGERYITTKLFGPPRNQPFFWDTPIVPVSAKNGF
jgi:cysteine synthase